MNSSADHGGTGSTNVPSGSDGNDAGNIFACGGIDHDNATAHTTVRFFVPFMLSSLDAAQPAGDYRVDQDQELLEILQLRLETCERVYSSARHRH
jgi:hypothetical protein